MFLKNLLINNINMKNFVEEVPEEHISGTRENFFQSCGIKFSSSFHVISLAKKISYCLSTSHNPEFRCVICTVTLGLHCSQPIRIK